MKTCPAVIAALPREVRALVKGWELHTLPGRVAVYTNGEAVVACGAWVRSVGGRCSAGGDGANAGYRAAFRGTGRRMRPCAAGRSIVRAGVVIDGQTGERFENSRFDEVLVTTGAIASVSEKRKLRNANLADAVDMEASAVARLAQALGLEFHAIEAISDEADFEMGGLSQFCGPDGHFREAAFALHVAARPALGEKRLRLGATARARCAH